MDLQRIADIYDDEFLHLRLRSINVRGLICLQPNDSDK